MLNQLNQTQKRTYQYWFVDGLAELGSGFSLLLLALYFWIQFMIPSSGLLNLLLIPLIFAFAFGGRLLLQKIKERSTYPRTGYIAYQKSWGSKKHLAVILGFSVLIAVINLYLILQGPQALNWMPALAGIILAFIFSWNGYQTSLLRQYFMAVFCLLASLGITFAGSGGMPGAALLCGLVGVALLIVGIGARWAYLRQADSLSEVSNDS